MRRRYWLLPFFSLLLALAALAVTNNPAKMQPAEAAPHAVNLRIITQVCQPDGHVRITLRWSPMYMGYQWADASLYDNGFRSGSFVGYGGLGGDTDYLDWDGFMPGKRHFMRLNTYAQGGWYPSPRIGFTTQACQTVSVKNLQVIKQECMPNRTVPIIIDWNPSHYGAAGYGTQYVDLSTYNSGFTPGTYYGMNVPGSYGNYTWDGLTPGKRHHMRVNSYGYNNWYPSQPVSFVTRSCR